jgi:class 3 adenylate cyclase
MTKIETIGDAYWCSHGLEASAAPSDARKMMRFANAMRRVVKGIRLGGEALEVRIGIHVRPMLGGIVGNRLPLYHLFGPHAKLAAMSSPAPQMQRSSATHFAASYCSPRMPLRLVAPAA